MRRLAIAIVTCVLALMAIVVLLLATLDIGRYRGLIETELSRMIGRDVALSGPMHLHLALQPTLVVERVAIANPPWASRPQFLTAERVEARVALLPLLSRRIDVDRLLVDGADLALEAAADGRRNWTFAAAPPFPPSRSAWLVRSAAAAMPKLSGDLLDGWTPFVRELRLRDSRVAFRDSAGAGHALRLASADLSAAVAGTPVAVDLAGAFDDNPIELHGELCPLPGLLGGPCPVALDGRISGLDVQVAGNAGRDTPTGLDLQVTVSATRASTLQPLLRPYLGRIGLPDGTGPLRLLGRLSGDPLRPAMRDVTLDGRVAGLDLQARGNVADVVGVGGIDLALAVEGDPAGLRALVPALPVGSLSLAARIRGGGEAWRIEDLSLRQGSTELAGSLNIALDGARPVIGATLTAPRLTIPLPVSARASAEAHAGAPAPLFSDEPFDLGWLQAADLDFRLQAGRALFGPLDLRDLGIEATLRAGVLDVGHAAASIADSTFAGSLVLDAGSVPATARLRLDAPALDLGAFLALLKIPNLVQATGRLHVDLKTAGASPHAMARGLAGRIEAVFENGRLNTDVASQPLLGLQRFSGTLAQPLGGEWAEMRCLAAVFAVRNGIARPDPLLIDGPSSSAVGVGKIDLGGERYALAVTSHAKGLGVGVPLRITGPLTAPELGLDEKRALEEGVGAILGELQQPGTAETPDSGAKRPCSPLPAETAAESEIHRRGPPGAVLRGLGRELRQLLPH